MRKSLSGGFHRISIIFFALITGSLGAYGLAYEGEIDFAYSGGVYMIDKTGLEDTVINRFIQALMKAGGFKQEKARIRNFSDENELFQMMKNDRVVVATVTQSFFKKYESELGLRPLVVPIIHGKEHMRYCLIARKDNEHVKTSQDLWAKKISVLDYNDDWFYEILRKVEVPEVILLEKLPDNKSVVMAVLNLYADAGLLTAHSLRDFFASHPQLKDEVKIVAKTDRLLIPPLVFQRGRLSEEEAKKLVSLLEDAPNNEQMSSILATMGFSGFRKVTAGEIHGTAQ